MDERICRKKSSLLIQIEDYLLLIIVYQHAKMVTSFLKTDKYNLLVWNNISFDLKRLNSVLRTQFLELISNQWIRTKNLKCVYIFPESINLF